MSIILTGSAQDRVSGSAGFIDVVTDPAKFISKMPARETDVISDIGNVKTLEEMLKDTGNPVYVYHKDGSKQFQEYYKGDYELKLVSFMSAQKDIYNKILNREEALTKLIDSEYPTMSLDDKITLASFDTRANQDFVKKLWGYTEPKQDTEDMHEDVISEDILEETVYPTLAEGGAIENNTIVNALPKKSVFSKKAKFSVSTSMGTFTVDKFIDSADCYIAVGDSCINLMPEDAAIVHINKDTISVFYSGVTFEDSDTGKAYTIFVKD